MRDRIQNGEVRNTFSLTELMRQTGLSRRGAMQAKDGLRRAGIITIYSNDNATDEIVLNESCYVVRKNCNFVALEVAKR